MRIPNAQSVYTLCRQEIQFGLHCEADGNIKREVRRVVLKRKGCQSCLFKESKAPRLNKVHVSNPLPTCDKASIILDLRFKGVTR